MGSGFPLLNGQIRPSPLVRLANLDRALWEFESPYLHSLGCWVIAVGASGASSCCQGFAQRGPRRARIANDPSEQGMKLLLGALVWDLRFQRILQDQPCSLRYRLLREDLGTHG